MKRPAVPLIALESPVFVPPADGDEPGGGWDALPGDETEPPSPLRRSREQAFPAELVVATDVSPGKKSGWRHGFHSDDVVQIPTGMSCNTCVLFLIKRKNPRSELACPEARKNHSCAILARRQLAWVEALIGEVREVTGRDPSATNRARIEQITRLRSRIFAIEVYVKAAGAIDLRSGELRAVVDRLNSVEGALTRALGELRSAMNEAREHRRPPAPSLSEYLQAIQVHGSSIPVPVEAVPSKEILTEASEEER